MTVISKFFVLRGAKFPAHGRVDKFRYHQTDNQSMKLHFKKCFELPCSM